MYREELFWLSFESSANSGLTIFDIRCAYKNGKEILNEIQIVSPFKDQKDIDYYLNKHKSIIKNVPFKIIKYKEKSHIGENFDFTYIFKNSQWVNKMKPVSKKFISFLKSQHVYDYIINKIPLNKAVVEEHLILIYVGAYCDDDKGYIDCVIQGAKTHLMLTWKNTIGGINTYPNDTTFDPETLVFEIPDFNPNEFIDYIESLKKRPKYFNKLGVSYPIREKLTSGGLNFLFKIKLNEKSSKIRITAQIISHIEERKRNSSVDDDLKEFYLQLYEIVDLGKDIFSLELDLGSAGLEELHNIFYLLDETNAIKSVSVTLK